MMPRRVVLVGMGHAHLHVVRQWARRPCADAHLICVSDTAAVPYSGMLPSVLAGEYASSDMFIDLRPLSRAAGADLHVAAMVALDHAVRAVILAGGARIPFDVLSIGVGSQPSFEGVAVHDGSCLVPHKPLASFLRRLEAQWQRAGATRSGQAPRLVVVGGGASGIELALCAPIFLGRLSPAPKVTLVAGEGGLLGDGLRPASIRALRALARAGVGVISGLRVTGVDGETLTLADGGTLEGDLILWATAAAPVPALDSLNLPTGRDGFPATDGALRSVADPGVFVTGDAGSPQSYSAPRSGVTAVRQGPVLDRNIRCTLTGGPLALFRPPRRTLRLLNLGNGHGIGEWGHWSVQGRWVRRWKDHLDRAFVRRMAVGFDIA